MIMFAIATFSCILDVSNEICRFIVIGIFYYDAINAQNLVNNMAFYKNVMKEIKLSA